MGSWTCADPACPEPLSRLMSEPSRAPERLPPAEFFQLVVEISCLVSQYPADELPAVIERILQGLWRIAGLTRGAISLLDDVNDRVYTSQAAGETVSFKPDDWSPRNSPSQQPSWKPEPSILGRASGISLRFPLRLGSQDLGKVIIEDLNGELILGREQEDLIKSLLSLAALAIARYRNETGRLHLQEWMDASSNVFAASRLTSTTENVETLLRAIVENAQRISEADFITLYEYFQERDDFRIPPTIAGTVYDLEVLQDRSVAVEHKRSVIFRILRRSKPLYAGTAPHDWIVEGLIDEEALADERNFFSREKVITSAGFPLRIESERVGVLFINYRRKRLFSSEFRERLESFASQVASALGNARLFLRSLHYIRTLEVLNDIGRELGSAVSRDIEQIGELIHQLTKRVIVTENFFLCLYDAKNGAFELPYIKDEHDSREVLLPGLREGLTGYVCRTRTPQLISPERKKNLIAEGEVRPIGRPSAIWLGAPLIVRDEVVGVLVVQDYKNETAFTNEHLQLLTAIASQAAIAIDNYRLLHDASIRLEELSALLSLSQAFGTGQLTSDQLLKLTSILDNICRLASCDGSLLLLTAPGNKSELKIAAASSSLRHYVDRLISRGEGVSGTVINTKGPFIKNGYAGWPDRSGLFYPPPEHVCAVPLIWNDIVVGVLTLSTDKRDRPLSQSEIEILQRFAGPAAIAIQSARNSSFREALINRGPSAIVAVDLEGRITEFSSEATRLFRYLKKDVLGKHVSKVFWNRQRFRRIQEGFISKGKIEEQEVSGRSKNGEKIPLSLTAVRLESDEEVIGFLGVVEDLRIQSLRGRTYLLVDTLADIGAQESLDEIIERVVDSSVSLLYADAGCLFLKEADLFRPKSPSGVDANFLDALAGGIAQDRLTNLAADDPKTIMFFAEAELDDLRLIPDARSHVLAPIRTDTRILAFLLIESRATDHFAADQKLLEVLVSQAAVSINRVQLLQDRERTERGLLISANAIAVGQIATTFLHEAKNSLNGISLTVQSLHEDIEREADLKAKKDYIDRLTAIQGEVARFDKLSRQLQRFTQQGLSPEKKEVYINPIVGQALVLLGSAIRSKNLKLETKLDPSLDAPAIKGKGKGSLIYVDEDQIQQVLMNLILNALAASGERRLLVVETKNLVDKVEIRVTDQGAGIPSEVRGNLFKPFFTTKKDGVGLGLFLSRMLIEENHGGSIEIVSSAPGKGTTFTVRLPKPKISGGT